MKHHLKNKNIFIASIKKWLKLKKKKKPKPQDSILFTMAIFMANDPTKNQN